MIRVTKHAIERWIERIAPVSKESARASILSHSRTLNLAVAFGSGTVKLGDGTRLVLSGNAVVTVLPKGWKSSSLLPDLGE